jgi:hypothetical protein
MIRVKKFQTLGLIARDRSDVVAKIVENSVPFEYT